MQGDRNPLGVTGLSKKGISLTILGDADILFYYYKSGCAKKRFDVHDKMRHQKEILPVKDPCQ